MTAEQLRGMLEQMVRGMVALPDVVRVGYGHGLRGHLFEIDVAPEDRGKVIGRDGKVADAIRTIVRAIALEQTLGHVVYVNILEDPKPGRRGA